jgi:hypothetical protein
MFRKYSGYKGLLNIYANGDDINIALAFINLMLIPSYPLAGLSLIVLITFSISLHLILFNMKLTKCFLKQGV